jgi:hypothetical protein
VVRAALMRIADLPEPLNKILRGIIAERTIKDLQTTYE